MFVGELERKEGHTIKMYPSKQNNKSVRFSSNNLYLPNLYRYFVLNVC